MTDYGMTDAGFRRKTLTEQLEELKARLRDRVAKTLRLDEKTYLGNAVHIVAEAVDESWEGLEVLVGSLDPDNAVDQLLVAGCKWTGVTRKGLQYGTVLLDVEFSSTQTIAIGGMAVAQDGDPENLWSNLVEIVGTAGGTVAGVSFRSVAPGAQAQAGAGTLTVPVSGATGVSSVTNPEDADAGSDVETIDELRVRRERSLARAGKATTAAVQAEILTGDDGEGGVPGVEDCRVLENETDATDVYGIPAKNIHVLIWDGVAQNADNTAVATAIQASRGAGCQTFGAVSVDVPDPWGTLKPNKFSRMTGVDISVAVTVTGDTSASVVQESIVSYGDSLVQGEDVIWSKIHALAAGAAGVDDVTVLTLQKGVGAPVSANLSMAVDEKALFETGNVSVTIL